jgi:hypothetical protein
MRDCVRSEMLASYDERMFRTYQDPFYREESQLAVVRFRAEPNVRPRFVHLRAKLDWHVRSLLQSDPTSWFVHVRIFDEIQRRGTTNNALAVVVVVFWFLCSSQCSGFVRFGGRCAVEC